MSPKKGSSRDRAQRKARQRLSGNPQRRQQQLREREDRAWGSAVPAPFAVPATPSWWPESHAAIIRAARTRSWPSDPLDIEALACELVGDEFYEQLTSGRDGLKPTQWLRKLILEAGGAVSEELQFPDAAPDPGSWPALCALLAGLALIAPLLPPDDEPADDVIRQIRAQFPDLSRPREAALAMLDHAAKLLAGEGRALPFPVPADGCQLAGPPLVARDAYGSRFLLVAPFTFIPNAPVHSYAFDLDECWDHKVVGAGVFESSEDALAEWRDAVGASSSGAELAPCPPELATRLLAPALDTGPFGEILEGNEPRELMREYFRLRRRAGVLADSLDVRREELARRSMPCSPHRISMAALLLRDGYFPEAANAALALLPEWTQWCTEQTGLDEAFAARSRETARAEAGMRGSLCAGRSACRTPSCRGPRPRWR